MKALIYAGRLGPEVAFLLPAGTGGTPESAAAPSLPGDDLSRAHAQLEAKGSEMSWPDWADALTRQLPYFGAWSLLEVPDGISAAQALHYARYRQAAETLPS